LGDNVHSEAAEFAARLSCWSGPVNPHPIEGGITNVNFTVIDGGDKYLVRIGEDIPIHGVMRFNELAASRAAHAAGVSPRVHHWQPGAMVLQFIEARTLNAQALRGREMIARLVPLLKKIHCDMPRFLEGPALTFWVFQVVRNYLRILARERTHSATLLERLAAIAGDLERTVGPIDLVFGHNDLLAANILDDGNRLWIIDWDYAGFNSPLFDLANLATNNEFDTDLEHALLQHYFDQPVSEQTAPAFQAMKCASLLRETLWSMVCETHSTIDFDYGAYSRQNLDRFERCCAETRDLRR
jgi:thiamine kinase-like enzyme